MAAGKPGAVHYAVVVFAMLFVICAVIAWMRHSDYNRVQAEFDTMSTKKSTSDSKLKETLNERDAILGLLGIQGDVGLEDGAAPDEGTVLYTMNQDIASLGDIGTAGSSQADGERSYRAALLKLRAALDNNSLAANQRQELIRQKDQEALNINALRQQEIDKHIAATQAAEAQLQKALQEHAEELGRKDEAISELRAEKVPHSKRILAT